MFPTLYPPCLTFLICPAWLGVDFGPKRRENTLENSHRYLISSIESVANLQKKNYFQKKMQKKLKKNDVFLLFRGYHGLKRKKVYRKVAKNKSVQVIKCHSERGEDLKFLTTTWRKTGKQIRGWCGWGRYLRLMGYADGN